MIVIIDYGLGNLNSIRNQLRRLKSEAMISGDKEDIRNAKKLILPGVGHFRHGMNNLKAKGLIDILNHKVLHEQVPILGICLGMQLFAEFSEEGDAEGLRWIPGKVVRFSFTDGQNLKVPHIGWNSLDPVRNNALIDGIDTDSLYYFVHSYHFKCTNTEDILAFSSYGFDFVSAVNRGNIFGTQFHPEKSHSRGIALLNNFANRI